MSRFEELIQEMADVSLSWEYADGNAIAPDAAAHLAEIERLRAKLAAERARADRTEAAFSQLRQRSIEALATQYAVESVFGQPPAKDVAESIAELEALIKRGGVNG